jgi:hypothetical protein
LVLCGIDEFKNIRSRNTFFGFSSINLEISCA